MDTVVPKKRGKTILIACGAVALLAAVLAAAWSQVPRGLQVKRADLDIAVVERGVFRDEIVLRASAEARDSVVLDSV